MVWLILFSLLQLFSLFFAVSFLKWEADGENLVLRKTLVLNKGYRINTKEGHRLFLVSTPQKTEVEILQVAAARNAYYFRAAEEFYVYNLITKKVHRHCDLNSIPKWHRRIFIALEQAIGQ